MAGFDREAIPLLGVLASAILGACIADPILDRRRRFECSALHFQFDLQKLTVLLTSACAGLNWYKWVAVVDRQLPESTFSTPGLCEAKRAPRSSNPLNRNTI